MNATQSALKNIEDTDDLLEKGLKLAGLVTRVFAEVGCDLVVRRKRSSSDKRLRSAFGGQRGPDFPGRF